jgi:NAD(P)-dependent dehydrogenase (short-subunit alcohol dehydrogenase family)
MKRYLITGASRGIGRAIAEKLAESNVTLFLHGRDVAALRETTNLVEAKGAISRQLRADLGDKSSIRALIEQVSGEPLDALINNAGIAVVKPLDKISIEEWERTFAVNVTAPFLLSQGLIPAMSQGGSIVSILSIAAKAGFAGWSSYCMSKFALEGFSQAIREELRARKIRVINIYPAATDTDIWNAVEGERPREKMISAGQVASAVAYALAQPSDVLIENITVGNLSGSL